jgi:hypothetical protein
MSRLGGRGAKGKFLLLDHFGAMKLPIMENHIRAGTSTGTAFLRVNKYGKSPISKIRSRVGPGPASGLRLMFTGKLKFYKFSIPPILLLRLGR